ncbi:MAG: hypothetical protein ACKO0M_00580 [Cyanobium sp.]
MREILFRVREQRPGHLVACSEDGALLVSAATREELHHEAREAVIGQLGEAHVAFRIRLSQQPRSLRPLVFRGASGRRAAALTSCCG